MYMECSKTDVLLWWILKNAWFCDKNWISWVYFEKCIFFNFKRYGSNFLCRTTHTFHFQSVLAPLTQGGDLYWNESWEFSLKNEFFWKMSKGALWGALRILKPRRYQKWKKRPFFDLGLTYHAKKPPLHSSISFGTQKKPSFLRWIGEVFS